MMQNCEILSLRARRYADGKPGESESSCDGLKFLPKISEIAKKGHFNKPDVFRNQGREP